MGAQKLSKEQELQLVQEYLKGETAESLCLKYGYKTQKSILDKVKKNVLDYEAALQTAKENRRGWAYSFCNIKNDFDAYFIGLLMTDGYLSTRGTDIGIDLIDEDCIEFLSNTIGKKYVTYKDEGLAFDKYKKQPRHRLILSDPKLVKEASRYGIIKNKTAVLSGFQLEDDEKKYIPYLIRGIIDGDGCIYKTSYGAPSMYIISKSKDFLIWVQQLMANSLYFKQLKLNTTSDGLFKLETANQQDMLKLMALVYDTPFGMSRKYNKLRETFRDYNRDILFTKDDGIVQTATEMA